MFYIGPHVSISGSLSLAPERARLLNATGFGMFTRNQRQWNSKPLQENEIEDFKKSMKDNGYTADMVLPHDSYLINLGCPDEEKRKKSLAAFIEEEKRVRALGLRYLNFHPGSHLKQISSDECMRLIALSLMEAMEAVPEVEPVLEITAGMGSNLGSTLEELKRIIEMAGNDRRLGICIDTCHAFQAGYDLSTIEKAKFFFDELENKLPGRLKGLHLNDAKAECGRHLDRHESLGKGKIGIDTFLWIAEDSRFEKIPMVLETPNPDLWPEEIATLLRGSS
ncbi:MAG: deoxyribonuclease IV [Sphaerochaetaceae bacterium]|nr:deoxyribonuclease IV [Sphaerochaetaceae bacterium]